MKIVSVKWRDASYDGGQYSRKSAIEKTDLMEAVTVGHLISRGKVVRLAQEVFTESKEYRHIVSIPHSQVIEIKELK